MQTGGYGQSISERTYKQNALAALELTLTHPVRQGTRRRTHTWKAKTMLRYHGATSLTPYNIWCWVLAGLSSVVDDISCLSHSWRSMVASSLQVDASEMVRFRISTVILLPSSTGQIQTDKIGSRVSLKARQDWSNCVPKGIHKIIAVWSPKGFLVHGHQGFHPK